jgi:hypothetical protein
MRHAPYIRNPKPHTLVKPRGSAPIPFVTKLSTLKPTVLTRGSSLGPYIVPTDQLMSFVRTFRLIGLVHPYTQSHASLADQVRQFLTYVQMQVNSLRMTYFASTRAATVSRVQATKQTLNQSQRTR